MILAEFCPPRDFIPPFPSKVKTKYVSFLYPCFCWNTHHNYRLLIRVRDVIKAAIIPDEIAIGVVNNKTTGVRIIPIPGKEVGKKVRVAAPLQGLTN